MKRKYEKNLKKHVMLRLTEEQYQGLTCASEYTNLSPSVLIRKALEQYLNKPHEKD